MEYTFPHDRFRSKVSDQPYKKYLSNKHLISFGFLFRKKSWMINHCEIGSDSRTRQAVLRSAMRQAPDVIFIGEIRDRDTMSASLAYAMSGHLVVATLHATNSSHALNRVISFYPPETRQALGEPLQV